jgi:hypothetical protein
MVNHYYFYCVDADFGPFFLKICVHFPYDAPSFALTATKISSASLPSAGWHSKSWTTVSSPVPTLSCCSGWPMR